MPRLRSLIFFAGFPPTIVQGSTSFVTTLPASTIAPTPIVTPGIIRALEKTKTLSSILTGAPFVAKEESFKSWPKV